MPTAQDILNVARSLIGVHETPPSSNIAHPITDWAAAYGWSAPDAWCAWKVSYDFWHVAGGKELIHGAATGGSWVFRDNGQKYGEIIGGPAVGAIDVMKYASDTTGAPTSHVGIVESVNRDGTWTNIEGNHQDQVMRVPRSAQAGTQHWFILPKYSATPKEEDEVGISQTEKELAPGQTWMTMAFGNPAQHAYCFLGLINRQQAAPAKVKITIQVGPSGGFGTREMSVPISTGAPGHVSFGLQVPEVGQLFGNANLGDYLLWITAVDQPITVVKTQSLIV